MCAIWSLFKETFGTMSRDFSESDAPGLAHEELVDAVFDDVNESNQVRDDSNEKKA